MHKTKTKQEPVAARRAAAADDPVPLPSGAIMEPTPEEIAAARKRKTKRRENEGRSLPPFHVHGVDYDKWATATIDLSDPPDRVAHQRRTYADKGYTKMRGDPEVESLPNAEVWMKTRRDWLADKQARHESIETNVRAKLMSPSATSKSLVHGPDGDYIA